MHYNNSYSHSHIEQAGFKYMGGHAEINPESDHLATAAVYAVMIGRWLFSVIVSAGS